MLQHDTDLQPLRDLMVSNVLLQSSCMHTTYLQRCDLHSELLFCTAGFETMQIIEECSCKNTLCYRVDHFQSFSELVMGQSNNTTIQKKRRERVRHKPIQWMHDVCKISTAWPHLNTNILSLQLINIGKCIGSCPGVKIPGTCYLWVRSHTIVMLVWHDQTVR